MNYHVGGAREDLEPIINLKFHCWHWAYCAGHILFSWKAKSQTKNWKKNEIGLREPRSAINYGSLYGLHKKSRPGNWASVITRPGFITIKSCFPWLPKLFKSKRSQSQKHVSDQISKADTNPTTIRKPIFGFQFLHF